MESCRLAELKYAIFSGTGRKTKKLRCSKLFLSTVSKHGLLEGSTFLFQYSSITHTPLESSQLGELKYAISAGQDVILKNQSLRKCKKSIAWRAYMVTVLWTGSDKFGQDILTSLHILPPNCTHALKKCLGRFISPFLLARLIGRGGNSPLSRFSQRKV